MSTVLNKKASHDYFFLEKFEAGIVLSGAEVKSLKAGNASLADSFVRVVKSEAFLVNAHISPYKMAVNAAYDPKRERKLLLNKKEIDFLRGKLSSSSLTIVPTKVYTKHNLVKVEVALAKAKKKVDKRETLKKKELEREAQAALRESKLKAQQ